MKIKIGTRGSKLALIQTNMVKEALEKKNPGLECEVVIINTKGDIDLKNPIHKVGKGVFVKEIEEELLKGDIDLAVHSMKDMPSEKTEGLTFFNPPKASDPRDVLVSNLKIEDLTQLNGKTIGTGSLRRQLQLINEYPEIKTVGIRGNIETRMNKIGTDEIVGVMLAYAGLLRAGYNDRVSYIFSLDEVIPSPCQGILAIQGRDNDEKIEALVKSISDENTTKRMEIEREFQRVLDAGCHSPMGFNAEFIKDSDEIILRAVFGDVNKKTIIKKKSIVKIKDAKNEARRLAEELKREA